MHDQTRDIYGASARSDPPARRALSGPGGSLLLVLFVLAALPPATFAQGLESQAVLELIGSVPDAPRREASRDDGRRAGARFSSAPVHQQSHSAAVIFTPRTSPAAAFEPAPAPARAERVDLGALSARRSFVREPLHDLPPPALA